MFAETMSTSDQLPYVVASYVVTFAAIGGYTWYMLRRARRAAAKVPVEERPWT